MPNTPKPRVKRAAFVVTDEGVFVKDFSGRKRYVHPWLDVQIWPYMELSTVGYSSFPVIHYYTKDDRGAQTEYKSAFNPDSPKRIAQVLAWQQKDAGIEVSDWQKKRLSEFIANELEKRTLANKKAFASRGFPVVFSTF